MKLSGLQTSILRFVGPAATISSLQAGRSTRYPAIIETPDNDYYKVSFFLVSKTLV